MIVLHHLRIGRSLFTVWQLEELGVDYELKVYHRNPDTFRAGDDLKAIHPLGKSPVIEENGMILSESGAITSYLAEIHDPQNRFAPSRDELQAWAKYTQWLHYPEGSVFGPLLIRMLLTRSGQPQAALDEFSRKEVSLHLGHIQNQLGDSEFILGDKFTSADFGISYVVSMAERLGELQGYTGLEAYIQRNRARPAFVRAVERAVE